MTHQTRQRLKADETWIATIPERSKAPVLVLSTEQSAKRIGDLAAEASLRPQFYLGADALHAGMSYEVAGLVCTESVLTEDCLLRLARWLQVQPLGCDVPVLVLADQITPERRRGLQEPLGNVVFLPASDAASMQAAMQSMRHSYLRRLRLRDAMESQLAELAQSDRNIRAVFETSHQYQGLLNANGKIIYANRVSLQSIGVKLEDVLGKSFWRGPWFSDTPGAADMVRMAVSEVAAGRTVRFRMTLTMAGGDKMFDFSMRPIFDEWETVVAMVPEAVDITARMQAEDGLRQSQKMEAVGQLTGGVAHDFNNLLTVIKSASELLKQPTLTDARRDRYVGAISETVDRAAKLTAQLLAFARRQALQPKVFDVCVNVASISDMMKTLCGSRIELVIDMPPEPCFVDADPSQFDTALVNMVVNARDAMLGEGRLVIRVDCLDGIPAVRAHPSVHAPYISVSITDTGDGIPADMIDKIFEPFFTTKSVGAGTGLGLSQVFGFAKQSDGEVMVRSAPGQGSTFTLMLRRADAPALEEREPAYDDAQGGQGAPVLVVEDNRDIGQFVTQSLEDLGYRPHWVANAKDALAILAIDADAYSVVFSDVVMPGMDGLAMGQEIRRLYPALPVVLCSGYSEGLVRDRDHGFDLLQKPYSMEQLSKILRRALARR